MKELSQQELLSTLKEALGASWDVVADKTGIAPRALKSYLLPDSSTGHRGMNKFVRDAVEKTLSQAQKKVGRNA